MRLSRRTLGAALVLAAGLLAACADAGLTAAEQLGGSALSPGRFRLLSINAKPLPYAVSSAPGQGVEITGGELVILTGWEFRQVLTFGETTVAGYAQRESGVTGTYILEGSRLRFRLSTGEEFEGTRLPNGQIEYTLQGNQGPLVFRYHRS